jgi:hypothetical protein
MAQSTHALPGLGRLALLAAALLVGAGAAGAGEPNVGGPPRAGKHQTASRKPARNEMLRRTLVQMGREDQAEIEESFRNPNPPPIKAAERQARLRQILAEHGWPGISLVGEDGADGAFLVAQHADEDVAFQRECLALLEEAYRRGDVPGRHLAYLTDRVRAAEGRPQVYGTQGSPAYDDVTRAAVNARRKQVGLPSMAETARRNARLLERAYRQHAPARPAAAKPLTPPPR